jgi:hypothetical protein
MSCPYSSCLRLFGRRLLKNACGDE